jgi:hypothetical protein
MSTGFLLDRFCQGLPVIVVGDEWKGKLSMNESLPPRSVSSRTGRTLALAVVIFGIAAQIAGIALGAGGQFWPFLRYPMYATVGESEFRHQELCVFTETGSHSVSAWDLGIPTFRYLGLLRGLGADGPAGDRGRARVALVVARAFEPGARIELWEAAYEMGPEGLVDAKPGWDRMRVWEAEGPDPQTEPQASGRRPISSRHLPRSGQCGSGSR